MRNGQYGQYVFSVFEQTAVTFSLPTWHNAQAVTMHSVSGAWMQHILYLAIPRLV
jgi:hypothetical protein